MKHFQFVDTSMTGSEAKVENFNSFKAIHVIANDEQEARFKGKVQDNYKLVCEFELNKDWN